MEIVRSRNFGLEMLDGWWMDGGGVELLVDRLVAVCVVLLQSSCSAMFHGVLWGASRHGPLLDITPYTTSDDQQTAVPLSLSHFENHRSLARSAYSVHFPFFHFTTFTVLPFYRFAVLPFSRY